MPHLAVVTISYGRAPLRAPPHFTLTQPSHSFAECIYTIANNKGIYIYIYKKVRSRLIDKKRIYCKNQSDSAV
jgi:hypothetical protein